MDKTLLISLLENIKKNKYEFQEVDLNNLLLDMLANIGDEDPYLRDELIYTTFCMLIEEKNIISKEDQIRLIRVLLSDDYLFFQFGNKGNTSILKRSFSVLWIVELLWSNQKEQYIDKQELENIVDKLEFFFENENDLRGYDPKLGFIHALAHTSDGFLMLAKTENIRKTIGNEYLNIVLKRLLEGKESFCWAEDERIITVIMEMISNKLLLISDLKKWMDDLKIINYWEYSIKKSIVRNNIKKFIRSFYFRVKATNQYPEFENHLIEIENNFNMFI